MRTPPSSTRTLAGAKRFSRQRDAIVKAFTASGRHMTVDELYECARRYDPRIGFTTVWRTLKIMEAEGLATSSKYHDGHTRYEYMQGLTHHDHLICRVCGAIEEFASPKIEALQVRIARSHRFTLTSHKMELYGICAACARRDKKSSSGKDTA